MKRERYTSWWPLALAAIATAGCGSDQGTAVTVVVRAIGTRGSLERFGVQAPGFTAGPLRYDGRFYTELTGKFTLMDLPTEIELTAFDGGSEVSSAILRPFVCQDAGLLGSGPVTETREVWIETDGTVWTTGDFDHTLSSRCESPATSSGAATGWTSPGYCSDPDRAGTQVALIGGGDWKADRCHASYSDFADGVLQVTVEYRDEGGDPAGTRTALLTLSHCIVPGETYPTTIMLPVSAASCRFDGVALSTGAGGTAHAEALAGSWELADATLERGGRLVGSVMAEFSLSGTSVQASGVFDIPHDMMHVSSP